MPSETHSLSAFIPASALLEDLGVWPAGVAEFEGGTSVLERVGVSNVGITETDEQTTAKFTLVFLDELVLRLPGLPDLGLVFGSTGNRSEFQIEIDLREPNAVRLVNVSVGLRFSASVLKPVRRTGGRYEVDPTRRHVQIAVTGSIIVGSEGIRVEGMNELSLSPCMIGNSGIVIEATSIALDLSADSTIPQAQAAGLPQSWTGVFIQEAAIHLPPELSSAVPSGLSFRNCFIGSGGFTGQIEASWPSGFAGSIGGVTFSLRTFALELRQNSFVRSQIHGRLTLPFFNQPLDVEIGFSQDGSLHLNLAAARGIVQLRREGFFDLRVSSMGFEIGNGVFTATISGTVRPEIGGLDWPAFNVRELSIDSNGHVRLDGGWLNLREQYSLNLHGFRMEITRLGFGNTEDGGRWIGFSGALRLVNGVQAGASVEGLRVTWYEDERPPQLTLNGVGVQFEVPNVLRFQGSISFEAARQRFTGNITLHLISLNLRVDAVVVFGTAEGPQGSYTYMGIHLGVELPAGIPLWSTGLALYGMAGLFALHMEPNKLPDEEWYNIGGTNSYYHRPTIGVTDLVGKWTNSQGSLALGAGVTVGTLADNGFTFSGRLMLVIVLPGPVIMLEGRASLLAQRARLNDEPNFRALAVLDNRAGTFLVGLDAQYKYDREGRLVNVRGGAEAFFNFSDAGAWHVYVGERDPREKRIRARIFSLFEASAYLMLDARQLAFGARVGYEGRWTFGPVRVTLEAWIEGNAALSWSPAHFHGDLALHARFELRVFGIGFTLGADASIAADVFDPYHIVVHLSLEIRLFWPIPPLHAEVTLEWGPRPVPPPLPLPLREIAVEHFKVTTSWPLPRGTLLLPNYDRGNGILADSPPPFDANAGPPADVPVPVVPLDCRPHITFAHPVHDDAMVGINPQPPDPARERIGDPAHNEGPLLVRYGLQEVSLERWNQGAGRWILVARKAGELIPGAPPRWRPAANPPGVKTLFGSWAPVPATPGGGGGEGVGQVKLWLWSKTPFDYTRHTERAWDEWFTDRFADYPCVRVPADREICCDFERFGDGHQLTSPWQCPDHPRLSVSWSGSASLPVSVVAESAAGLTRALCFPARQRQSGPRPELTVLLPEPARAVRLVITDEQGVQAWGVNARGRVFGPFFGGNRSDPLLEVRGEDMVRIIIQGVYRTCLFRVCAVVGPDESEAIEREEMMRHLRDETARWSQEGDVLEPHTTYRLKAVTTVQAQGEAELAGWSRDATQIEYAFFRTEGPPGLTTLSTPAGQPEGATFDSGLNDLARYVRQTVPATVPREGERPSLPRPVYRAYDVGVEFNEDYVELMYRLGRRDLGLYLYDNNNRPVQDAQGRLAALTNHWGRREELTLTESERRWVRMVNTSTCAALSAWERPRAATLGAQAAGLVLEADTVYEARLTPLLLHEDFRTYERGAVIVGPAGTAGGWSVHDEGVMSGPSRWEIGEDATARSRFVVQTTDIWGGTLDGRDPVKPGTTLLRGETDWTAYRLTVHLRSTLDDDALGVVFRRRDANNYYRFSMDRQRKYRRLVRVAGGAHTILAEDNFVHLPNQDYQITAQAVGSSLRLFQDGVLVFDVTDASHASGQIGLYCWGNVGARFSEVLVDDLRPQAPVVYRFKFTTSQFANFFHHVHSFEDESWLAAPTLDELPDETFSRLAGRAVAPTDAPSEEEAGTYEELAASVLKEAARQSPREVQATWVERNGERVALLLRSPEPIDWRRTSVGLRRADTPLPRPAVPRGVKLTDATFSTSRPNDESVSLLLREPTELTRHRIELRRLPGAFFEPVGDPLLLSDEFDGPAGAATEAANVLWETRFSDLGGVEIVDEPRTIDEPSQWVVEGGELRQLSNIYGRNRRVSPQHYPGTYALAGSPEWRDMEISLELRSDDNDAIGVMFRYQDRDNYYRFSMDRERRYRRLIKKVGGRVSVLWQDAEPYRVGQTYEVVLRLVGSELRLTLDGVVLFTVYDNDLMRGRIGFYCWANRGARFGAVSVVDRTRRLGQWSIWDEGVENVPSAWRVDGGALLQTSAIDGGATPACPGTYCVAGDKTWTDYRLIARMGSDEDGAIGLVFRYADENNYYRLSLDSARGYGRLIRKARGVLTTLWEDAGDYRAGEPFTLTVDAVGPRLAGYVGGVRLFELNDNTLAAGRVGLYCWANSGARFERVEVQRPTLEAYARLRDHFAAGHFYGWRVVDEGDLDGPSNWWVNDGALHQTSNIHSAPDDRATLDKRGTQILSGDRAWTDVVLSTRLQSSGGSVGMLFRYVDANNYYRFSMDREHGHRRLVKNVGGTFTLLWEDATAFEAGRNYELTVAASGNRLLGYLDGVPMFVVEDDSLAAGEIGLYCWKNSRAQFSQVRVFPADVMFDDWLLNEPFDVLGPGRWTFVDEGDHERPSQWEVTGGELRQTGGVPGGGIERGVTNEPVTYALAGDATWADYRIVTRLRADVSDGAIGVMFRYRDADNYYRFSMDGEGRYRRLIKKVAGVVTVLWEDAVAYESGREYLLTLDCVGGRLTGHLDGASLFSLADGVLTAGRVGLFCRTQPGARFAGVQVSAPVWANYYTFGREARLPAGTRVRVHAGNQTDETPPHQPGVVQRFVSSPGERGQLRLRPEDAELRLREPGHNGGHGRRFLHDAAYAEEYILVQRKADGTGLFLFRPYLAPFPVGQYRLTMTYRRDNRTIEPESQVLSEAGNRGPEQVVIDIPWQPPE